jgi:hypothetical protein
VRYSGNPDDLGHVRMTAIGFWQCGQQVICGASWYDIALPTRYVWVWLRQAAIVAVKRPHRSAKSISVSRHLAGRPICFAPHPSYLDQFCLSVLSAWFSSARHASLFRPRSTAPRPAASQLGPTCRTGGPPPPPRPCAVRDCDRDGFWDCHDQYRSGSQRTPILKSYRRHWP